MTPQQIQQVRLDFACIVPIADQAATIFYANLFHADPSLRTLFRGDMHEQGAKLIQMIAAAVRLLDRPDDLLPVLRKLGIRHTDYGVQPEHYATVGSALLETLATGLGAAFNAASREAWVSMYTLISDTMIEACAEALV